MRTWWLRFHKTLVTTNIYNMKKRLFIITLLAVTATVGLTQEHRLQKSKAVKPNVLFICVDDLRPELGCYGADYIHSPNIDRLASASAVFKNHFAVVPPCGASRYRLLTGMLPRQQGQLSKELILKTISGQPD